MQIIENSKIKEKAYVEKLVNGLTVILVPKENTNKKSVIYGVKYGSIDHKFIDPNTKELKEVPDGVAHFLEHKMFEQENGTNSLDVLSSLGVDANAYTTNDHTAYLINATNHFEEAFDELLDYVQHPYFTKDNVEKEKGIIGQEIMMYEDDASSKVYLNLLKCLYEVNPVNIDIAGTVESIQKIDENILYDCYHTFYHPSNMALVVCGNFNPIELLEKIKEKIISKPTQREIKRIYPEEKETVFQDKIEEKMNVSNPIFVIGIKDRPVPAKEKIVKTIVIEILLQILLGSSSELYQELYEKGEILSDISFDYEFSDEYSHIMMAGQSKDPIKILEKLQNQIEKIKQSKIDETYFKRIKKKIYGGYITDYNSTEDIARIFLTDYFQGINSFEYLEAFSTITKEMAEEYLNEIFKKENMAISIIRP